MNLTYNKFFAEVITHLLANEDTSIYSFIHSVETLLFIYLHRSIITCAVIVFYIIVMI